MNRVSVIIPIYNVEKYLRNCLDSVLNQTYKALEVILVNDGSLDKSLMICREYEKKDERIKVIDKPNEGVAIARNTGLEQATGEYITFVDPDDWIEPDMYEALVRQLEKWEAPISLCNFYKDTNKKSQPKYFDFKDEVLIGDQVIEELVNNMIGVSDLLPKYVYIMGCVWRGLYRRDFIEEHHLRFVPQLTIMEDLVFMVQILLKCNKVAIDQGLRYHYVQHNSSALHSYNEKMWDDQLIVYNQLEKSICEAGLEERMRNRLDYRYIGMIFSAIKNETFVKKDSDFKETLLRMMEIFKDDTLKEVLERVKPIQVEKSLEKVDRKKDRAAHESKTKQQRKRAKRTKSSRNKEKISSSSKLGEKIERSSLKDKKKELKKKTSLEKKPNKFIKKLREISLEASLYKESDDEYNE